MDKRRGLLRLCLIALALMLPCGSLAETARGFDTPEACATALYESLSRQDTAAMEACIAFREMAEQFDFAKYCDRIGAIPIYTTLQPATTSASIAYNEYELKSRWYWRLNNTLMMVNNPAFINYLNGGSTINKQTEDYQTVMDMYSNPANLKGLSDLTMTGLLDAAAIPKAGITYASEKNQQNIKSQLAVWGVTNFRELAIQLQWNVSSMPGVRYEVLLPLQLIEVKGRWLVNPNGSNVGIIMGISNYYMLGQLPESD
ncbi:MAG: hypothetical protein GX418_15345 [Clostridiales bacterium]|nr:hypothetical protein [Clostridiales bacterium]